MSTEAIMADLHEIANVGEGVELLNLYKGVPIVNKATFVHFEADSVTLKTQRPQLVCLERDGRTVVLSDIMQVALSAQVAAVDRSAETVTLDHLAITDKKVGDRMTVRVEPKEAISVDVTVGSQKIAAALADISMSGAGLHVQDTTYEFKKKMPVRMTFQLPGGQIDSSGIVRYAKQETDRLRVGVDLSQDIHIRAMIARYVNARRAEILGELDAA